MGLAAKEDLPILLRVGSVVREALPTGLRLLGASRLFAPSLTFTSIPFQIARALELSAGPDHRRLAVTLAPEGMKRQLLGS